MVFKASCEDLKVLKPSLLLIGSGTAEQPAEKVVFTAENRPQALKRGLF
jgi:hypothetical protein